MFVLYKRFPLYIKKLPQVELRIFSKDDEIPPPEKARRHTLMDIDDAQLQGQNIIWMYMSLRRHKFVDCVYMIQSYANIPKHNLRDNCNCMVVFKQNDLNLKHIYNDHARGDMDCKLF